MLRRCRGADRGLRGGGGGGGTNYEYDVVYGVLSWGYGCVNRDYPTIITRVSDHYDWIRETVCRSSSDPPPEYECHADDGVNDGGDMTETNTQVVTLKLKLDLMAVETGFVIEALDSRKVVAQRQVGYYKDMGNDVVRETMELPSDGCYRLILLDSYGDGFCCDMGGGDADNPSTASLASRHFLSAFSTRCRITPSKLPGA